MSVSNTTNFANPSTFILQGIPGLETAHGWISIPFCIMYIIALVGNFTILFIVKIEPSLHEPMYYFLCMLAVTDLVLCTSTLPKTLSIFWFNSKEIDFGSCLIQMFFIGSFLAMESGIIVAMALDRYVAICHPLRHSSILTNSVVARIGLAMVLRSCIVSLPYPLLARQWPYCHTNVISHSFCEMMAVVKLSCTDTSLSNYYGLIVTLLVAVMDVFSVTVSYTQICVTLSLYIPVLFTVFTHRFGLHVPLYFHILIANLYLILPPMLNPIIYGVRTKQIRDRLLRHMTQTK
ncbi:olfactory receptor 52N4-like [Pelodiscus sinensis]|uniref:olfactory receptor 52N4-like n=1 Tax=Pelodiscus sinensis TaxID=13735 RepID=UPI003F6CBABB